jgi:hypothetical protein
LKQEANQLFDLAVKDVKRVYEKTGPEKMKGVTLSFLCGFLNDVYHREHSVEAIQAALRALNIWYRGE